MEYAHIQQIFPHNEGFEALEIDDTTQRVQETLLIQDPQELEMTLGRLASSQDARDDFMTHAQTMAIGMDHMWREQQVKLKAEQERAAEAERRADTDEMTGLPNQAAWRRHVTQTVERMEEAIERGEDPGTLAISYMDADSFKRLNDTLGHHAGDIMIKAMGWVLANNIRTSDDNATPDVATFKSGRLGGDEFVVAYHFPPESAADTHEGGRRTNDMPYEERVVAVETRLQARMREVIQRLNDLPEAEGGIPGLLQNVPYLDVTIGHRIWESGMSARGVEKAADAQMQAIKDRKKAQRTIDPSDTYRDSRD